MDTVPSCSCRPSRTRGMTQTRASRIRRRTRQTTADVAGSASGSGSHRRLRKSRSGISTPSRSNPVGRAMGSGPRSSSSRLSRCAKAASRYFRRARRNVPLYERLGFEVVEEADSPEGGPHVWLAPQPLTWREPATRELDRRRLGRARARRRAPSLSGPRNPCCPTSTWPTTTTSTRSAARPHPSSGAYESGDSPKRSCGTPVTGSQARRNGGGGHCGRLRSSFAVLLVAVARLDVGVSRAQLDPSWLRLLRLGNSNPGHPIGVRRVDLGLVHALR